MKANIKNIMKNIGINEQDYEFLKDLQNELNTQDNDGTADPLYWMVMDKREVVARDGEQRIPSDDGAYTLEELVQQIDEQIDEYDEQDKEEWTNSIDHNDAEDVAYFAHDSLGWGNIYYNDIYYVQDEEYIPHFSGAFLTKRACKQHIETNMHHYTEPHTYAMCAYRNYELERLLKILKTIQL